MPPAKKATKTTTKKSTKNTDSAIVAPTIEPPVMASKVEDNTVMEVVPATAEADVNEVIDPIGQQFLGVVATLSNFNQQISALKMQIRNLEKNVRKEIKGLQKEAAKNKNKGNRKPSGFAKPSKVSDALCSFMNKESGTEIARTEVTQYLINYINEKDLQYKDNKKIIMPDNALKSLLNVKEGQEVTYFNIQALMNQHFIKKTVSA